MLPERATCCCQHILRQQVARSDNMLSGVRNASLENASLDAYYLDTSCADEQQ